MGQQEFEPQEQPYDEEMDPLRYPYSWSDQPRQRGMPRDERPGISTTWSRQTGSLSAQLSSVPMPSRGRPQPRHHDPLVVAAVVTLIIFLILVATFAALVSFLDGTSLFDLTIAWVAWGAALALLVFVCLLIALVLRLVFRAVGQGRWHQGNRSHKTRSGLR